MRAGISRNYIEWLKTRNCSMCGKSKTDTLDIVPHHLTIPGIGNMVGGKPLDLVAVPLCVYCHERVHRVGRKTFWQDTCVESIVFECLSEYGNQHPDRVFWSWTGYDLLRFLLDLIISKQQIWENDLDYQESKQKTV